MVLECVGFSLKNTIVSTSEGPGSTMLISRNGSTDDHWKAGNEIYKLLQMTQFIFCKLKGHGHGSRSQTLVIIFMCLI